MAKNPYRSSGRSSGRSSRPQTETEVELPITGPVRKKLEEIDQQIAGLDAQISLLASQRYKLLDERAEILRAIYSREHEEQRWHRWQQWQYKDDPAALAQRHLLDARELRIGRLQIKDIHDEINFHPYAPLGYPSNPFQHLLIREHDESRPLYKQDIFPLLQAYAERYRIPRLVEIAELLLLSESRGIRQQTVDLAMEASELIERYESSHA
jgi:hypothetical protein